MLFATGAGQTDPPGVDGEIEQGDLPKPRLAVSVSIGGQAASILYAGSAPGLAAGSLQVNVRIPDNVNPGAAKVVLSAGGFLSQPGVTLAIR